MSGDELTGLGMVPPFLGFDGSTDVPVVAFEPLAGQCQRSMRRIVRDLQGIRWSIPTRARASLLGTAVACAALAGCGRPATKADCDEIFDKSAQIELKLQNVTDPAEVKKRTDAVRAARGETIVNKCIGRRVTEKALACVRNSTTAEQVDRCLD